MEYTVRETETSVDYLNNEGYFIARLMNDGSGCFSTYKMQCDWFYYPKHNNVKYTINAMPMRCVVEIEDKDIINDVKSKHYNPVEIAKRCFEWTKKYINLIDPDDLSERVW
ncbi:hypothetical protein [Parabacteroides provencensis]|uniref:hypothetical protein n=1 Tax=Parabacteroides provencensis TaxID=1944636 RepID=UPI000C161C9B|nr:hypothetical protein [Parabacteroides provencensis]